MPAVPEKRIAKDGIAYTLDEFCEHYGAHGTRLFNECPSAGQPELEQPHADVSINRIVEATQNNAEQPAFDVTELAGIESSAQQHATFAGTRSSAKQPAFDLLPVAKFSDLRKQVLDPLYAQCQWNELTHNWMVLNKEIPLALDTDYWEKVLGADRPADTHLVSCIATFFEHEPDHNRQNKPRLDIVLSFSNGRTVRYHPRADLIWSDEQQPTKAMQQRLNRAAKLQRARETADQ